MKQNKKGFTLIELLVVIAIIGILAAITVVSVQGPRNKATDTKYLSDLRQIASLMEQYAGTNSGSYAIAAVSGATAPLRWAALQTSLQAAAGGSILPTTATLPTSGDAANAYDVSHCVGATLTAGLGAGETSYVLSVTSKNVATNSIVCKTGANCSATTVTTAICP